MSTATAGAPGHGDLGVTGDSSAVWPNAIEAVVSTTDRTLTIELPRAAVPTTLIYRYGSTSFSSGDDQVQDMSDILARLRQVEADVSSLKGTVSMISERLTHMPTSNKMFVAMGAAALLLIAGTWAVLTFAGPAVLEAAIAQAIAAPASGVASPKP